MRKLIPAGILKQFARVFPKSYKRIKTRSIFNNLMNYYDNATDSVCINGAKYPLSTISTHPGKDIFFIEYKDLIYPYIEAAPTTPRSRYTEGPYELGHVILEPNDIVIDCGANIGLFTNMAAANSTRCYAFEPIEENWRIIKEITKFCDNVEIVPYALSDSVGKVQFNTTGESNGVAHMQGIGMDRDKEDFNAVVVDTTTIDTFVEEQGLSKVDFIKADIEGAERLMLKGAQKTLAEFAPKLSICTYHLPDDPEVLEDIILESNSNYIVEHQYKKLYAYVPS